jgi:ribonuclease E
MSVESAAVSFLRRIQMGVSKGNVSKVEGTLPVDVAGYLQNRKRKELADMETRYGVTILLHADPFMPPGGGKVEFAASATETAT